MQPSLIPASWLETAFTFSGFLPSWLNVYQIAAATGSRVRRSARWTVRGLRW